MSSLQQRRNSPRRNVGGMHPGWFSFICAWASGLLTGLGLAVVRVKTVDGTLDWSVSLLFVIAVWLFIAGGRKAERLHE